MAYSKQGKYDEAIKLFEEIIQIDKKTVGTNHLNFSTHLNNLGGVYYEQGKYNKALPLIKEAYQVRVRLLGENHPVVKDIKKGIENCQREIKEQASLIVPYKN